tara:strand:- start:19038 stop:19763 length:726 start_codon:yes stop_codon:yes gene_type:complete
VKGSKNKGDHPTARIWHISDTHTYQEQIIVPENIDIVLHSGDATNWQDPYRNEPEMWKFLEWFSSLEIPNKVFVAGNHDTSIESGLVKADRIRDYGITYLFNDSVEIGGFKIWGSPHTPTFGEGWAFMRARNKIHKVWEQIPDDTDIIVTHGPPKGILDLTWDRNNVLDTCGCSALLKRILAIEPKLVCFGHIHNTKDIYNAGTKQITGLNTIFSNGSCVNDGKWGIITSHGNVIELRDKE